MTRRSLAATCMVVAMAMAGRAHAQSARVPGFLPSENAFQFFNGWNHGVPDVVINVAGQNVSIGDAGNGLCGGMVLAVRDYYQSSYHVPLRRDPPAGGTPLFNYIVGRLFDTFTPGMVAALYWQQSSPFDWDRQNVMQAEWPALKAEIDAGHLTPLQLVRVHADANPGRLGENHQVLAYGYDFLPASTKVAIRIYDPNHPTLDDVTITYDYAYRYASQSTGEPLYSFFREDYVAKTPPATQTWTNGFEGGEANAWWHVNGAGIINNGPSSAHRGNGYAYVYGVPAWNEVSAWVPTLPGRTCTMAAYGSTYGQTYAQVVSSYLMMRSATQGNATLGYLSFGVTTFAYHRYASDFTADGWWAIFSVADQGWSWNGALTVTAVDDVIVVCEAW